MLLWDTSRLPRKLYDPFCFRNTKYKRQTSVLFSFQGTWADRSTPAQWEVHFRSLSGGKHSRTLQLIARTHTLLAWANNNLYISHPKKRCIYLSYTIHVWTICSLHETTTAPVHIKPIPIHNIYILRKCYVTRLEIFGISIDFVAIGCAPRFMGHCPPARDARERCHLRRSWWFATTTTYNNRIPLLLLRFTLSWVAEAADAFVPNQEARVAAGEESMRRRGGIQLDSFVFFF